MSPTLDRLRRIAALALLLPLPALAAEADTYRLDPVHTRVMFAISHAGFSNAIGTVSGSTGTLVFDPEDWTTASLKASVPIARVDLGDAKWNEATLAGNLLDAKDHPTAEFVSTRIEPLAADRARVHGTLTLRGVSQPVTLDVKLNALKRHPLPPFRRTVGFSATATLSRKAFGIDAWSSVIGDSVELRIEAEAIRQGGKTEDPATDPGDGATAPPPPASS
jgi:polyisoprenoid-binding protein YceI